mmetsp:Transcript_61928/g.108892  ORF Transcript_61928/g.108892 Transcript_61928/m.108892 type:complete len:208 (+) Transcript_61928:1164-1787(+)
MHTCAGAADGERTPVQKMVEKLNGAADAVAFCFTELVRAHDGVRSPGHGHIWGCELFWGDKFTRCGEVAGLLSTTLGFHLLLLLGGSKRGTHKRFQFFNDHLASCLGHRGFVHESDHCVCRGIFQPQLSLSTGLDDGQTAPGICGQDAVEAHEENQMRQSRQAGSISIPERMQHGLCPGQVHRFDELTVRIAQIPSLWRADVFQVID